MKKIIFISIFITLLSCRVFKQKEELIYQYKFVNKEKINAKQVLETIVALEKRFRAYGSDFDVKQKGNKNIILKIKADSLDKERINSLVLNQGKLEFWELYKGDNLHYFFEEINMKQKVNTKINSTAGKLVLNNVVESHKDSAVIFSAKQEDTLAINTLINNKNLITLLSSEHLHAKFLWGILDDNGYLPLYAAKSNKENKAPLTGASITDTKQVFGVTGIPEVSINMNKSGAFLWEKITGNAFKQKTCIAITLNGLVYSAPRVVSGAIQGGRSSISGNFTLQEAQDLAVILSSGKSIPKLKFVKHIKPQN